MYYYELHATMVFAQERENRMSKDYELVVEADYILARFTPSVYSSTGRKTFQQLIDEARNAGVSKILCDYRDVTGKLTTIERFNHASLIAEMFGGFKLAFVLDESLLGPDLFGENVAVNRGANIRTVATMKEAIEWLQVNPPSEQS
jgi:hypothetical protein